MVVFFQAEGGVRDVGVTGVQTCALPILYSFGYPASQKYHGNDLTYCAGPISTDPNNANLTWGMACDMTGGSSGGPWVSSRSEARRVGQECRSWWSPYP